MKRFVGLDGIKGLALIAIVLYHCMQQRLPGGFYGVDVFFTVSGFLIAVSLIRSLAKTGSLNLVRYIPKRAVRLYPALFLLREWRAMGGRIILTADAHRASAVVWAYDQAAELARTAGFREHTLLTCRGPVPDLL